MQWLEIALTVAPEQADAVADLLGDFGYQGVSVEHVGIMPDRFDDGEVPPPDELVVRAYVPDDEDAPAARQQIEAALAPLNLTPVYAVIDEQNWANAWKVHYHPVRIGRQIVVRPLWEEAELQPGDVEIALDPGMAFGTGTHATTQLCLASLEDLMRPGLQVLDLGSGSGILAIAAVKLGAASVVAVDIDPVSVEATLENADVNGVAGKITAFRGSLPQVLSSARRYDLLLANILARIIIQMCGEGLGQIVRPGGRAIFSGIITEQIEDVKAALITAGLTPTRVRIDGDWVAIEAVRPGDPTED
jgi:ribosomal protein L11 methyltransferase